MAAAMSLRLQVTHAGVEAIIFQVVLSLKSLADKAEGAEQRAIAAVSHSTGVPIPTILAEVEAGKLTRVTCMAC